MVGKLFKRLSRYSENIGFLRGFGMALHKFIGKLLNPDVDYVWGGLGEDALIWFYLTEVLGIRRVGYYVDVGCNHPLRCSNTYRLYQNGWRGLAIDADRNLMKIYEQMRPRDIAVTALISDTEQDLEFSVFDDSEVSSVDPEHVLYWSERRTVTEVRKIRTEKLGDVLARNHVPFDFDFLKVDVEGHDAAVLRSVDLNKYRPILVLVEIHADNVENAKRSEVHSILQEYGYQIVSLAGYNGFYIRTSEFPGQNK